MRRIVTGALLVGLAACGRRAEPVSWETLAASPAVQVLKAPDSPFRIIYSPPVDLTKRPAAK